MQKQFIELVAKKFMTLNRFQYIQLVNNIEEKNKNLINLPLLSVNMEWPQFDPENAPKEAKFPQHEEIIKELATWYKEQVPNFGLGGGQVQIAAAKVDKIEEKKADTPQVVNINIFILES